MLYLWNEQEREYGACVGDDMKLREVLPGILSNAVEEDEQRSLQAGMDARLNKPVESEQLMRVLGEPIYEAEEA